MYRLNEAIHLLMSVVAALLLSTVVRATTAGLNDSLGRLWPFSLTHCDVPATPGCSPGDRAVPRHVQDSRLAAWRGDGL